VTQKVASGNNFRCKARGNKQAVKGEEASWYRHDGNACPGDLIPSITIIKEINY
jgi:hypothetical protein